VTDARCAHHPYKEYYVAVFDSFNVWNVLESMIVFMFIFMFIWIFIAIFADIFRRDDLSGWGKTGWILLIFIIPLIGVLIYVIARPKMTEQDKRMMEEAEAQQRRAAGYSSADELAKLAELHKAGSITDEEYAELKRKAM
jgi:uncharacterized membrane protein